MNHYFKISLFMPSISINYCSRICLILVLSLTFLCQSASAEGALENLLNFKENGFRVDLFKLKNTYQLRISPNPEVKENLRAGTKSLKTFYLPEPPRYVVDVPGVIASKSYIIKDVKNEDIKKLRIGLHEDKIRLVLDLSSKFEPKVLTRRDADSLDYVVNLSFSDKKEVKKESSAIKDTPKKEKVAKTKEIKKPKTEEKVKAKPASTFAIATAENTSSKALKNNKNQEISSNTVISLKGDKRFEQSKKEFLEKKKEELSKKLKEEPKEIPQKAAALKDEINNSAKKQKVDKTASLKKEEVKKEKESKIDATKVAATGAALSVTQQLKKVLSKKSEENAAPIKAQATSTTLKIKEPEAKKPLAKKIEAPKESAQTTTQKVAAKTKKVTPEPKAASKVATKRKSVDPKNIKNTLKSIKFIKQKQDKSTVVVLDISSKVRYRIHPSSTKKNLYIFLIESSKIGSVDLNMPQFPRKGLEGYEVVVARKKKDQVVLRLYMKEGYAPHPLRVQGNIWLKAIKY